MCTQGPDHVEALVFQGTRRRGRPIKTFTEAILKKMLNSQVIVNMFSNRTKWKNNQN